MGRSAPIKPADQLDGAPQPLRRKLLGGVAAVTLVTLAAMAVVCLGGGPSGRDVQAPLRVGYALEAPYVYLDANGRVSGESPEVLRALLRQMGMAEPVWIHQEFPKLTHELLIGRIDVIAAGLFITPERSRQMAFTRPTVAVGSALLVPGGNPHGLQSVSDLAARPELKLAVIDGAVENRLALAQGLAERQLLRLPDAQSGLAAVSTREAAAFALSAPSLRWMSRQADSAAFEVIEQPASARADALGYPAYALRKNDPLHTELDQAMAALFGSPQHLEIERRHGMTPGDVERARRWTAAPAARSPSASQAQSASGRQP